MSRALRRVVVTAVGAVSPLGLTVDATWDAMLAGRSGVAPIGSFDARGLGVRIAAEVDDFDGDVIFGKRRARHLDRVVQFALAASRAALQGCEVDVAAAADRIGVVYGTGIGGLRSLTAGMDTLRARGP